MPTREQFVLLLIHFALVNSFALINIRNINEDELIDKLLKVLDSGKSERTFLKNHVDVRSSRKDLHDAHVKFERLKQIKDRIPYGPRDVNLEIENEPIYKIFKRIHNKIPIFTKNNDEYIIRNVERTGSFSFSHSYPKDLELHGNNTPFWQWRHNKFRGNPPKSNAPNSPDSEKSVPYNWQQWLAPNISYWKHWTGSDRKKPTRNEHFTTFWKKLKNLKKRYFETSTEKGEHERSRIKRLRQEIFNTQEKRHKKWSDLRSRSGEEHDPLAPGKVPFNIELHEETTVKPQKWLPSYPYWNYWTYDKSLYQDECKGDSIKVGYLCIRPPPH